MFGTGILGGLCAYPVAVVLMGQSAGSIAFYAYIIPFLVSTVGGSILSGVILYALRTPAPGAGPKLPSRASRKGERPMFGTLLKTLRAQNPLIHCITNYVTANDCANLLLACGARPIMADDPGEVEEITALAAGLVLNIGTLHQQTLPAMEAAGRRAKALGHPWCWTRWGRGPRPSATSAALRLLEQVRPTLIRGNASS